MAKRTTIDLFEVRTNYGNGNGWECECVEHTRFEANNRLKEYRENASCDVKVVLTRKKIKDCTEAELEECKQEIEKARIAMLARMKARRERRQAQTVAQ